MKKDDWRRLWMHFPWGALAAFVYTQDPVAGLAILASEFIYEAFNDWRKKDWSYKDVLGIVWGFMIPITIWRIYLWVNPITQ